MELNIVEDRKSVDLVDHANVRSVYVREHTCLQRLDLHGDGNIMSGWVVHL